MTLEIGASDEASKQAGEGDFDFSCLSERLIENERRSRTGWRQQRIQDGPSTVSSAKSLQHLANASVLDIRDIEVDGRAGNGARRWGSKL